MNNNKYISFASGTATELDNTPESRLVVYPIGKYEIVVKVSSSGEFIGIEEVRINKNFYSFEQRKTTKGYHDVNEFYR